MRIILLCSLILVFSTESIFPQKYDSHLIVNFQDEDYFAPDILNYLRSLKVYNDGETKSAFKNIIVLNQLQSHIKEQASIKELTDYFKQDAKYVELSNSAKHIYDTISKSLGSYNSFLEIKINQINNLIELQFSLFTNILNEGQDNFTTKDPRYPDKYQSVVFIPQERDYLHTLHLAIQRLFPETNCPPQNKIFINDNFHENGSKFYCAMGDTITLDGRFSIDQESTIADLTFLWRGLDTLSIFNSLPIDYTDPTISFSLNKPGVFLIGFSIFDGIIHSSEDTIQISVINKPRIFIDETNLNSIFQESGSLRTERKKSFNYEIYVSSMYSDSSNTNLIVTDLNENAYLKTTDPLQIAEEYLRFNKVPPPLETINKELLPNRYRPRVTLDSISNLIGGYKLFFSCFPLRSVHTFQIKEQFHGVSSNDYYLNFSTSYLSPIKFGLRYQSISLTSNTLNHWGDSIVPSTSNDFLYLYNNFFPYVTLQATNRLRLDLNISPLYYSLTSNGKREYSPIFQFNYEIGTQDYLIFSPSFSFGSSRIYDHKKNTLDNIILGYGATVTYCPNIYLFFSLGLEYLDGVGNDFRGRAANYDVRIDLIKALNNIIYAKR